MTQLDMFKVQEQLDKALAEAQSELTIYQGIIEELAKLGIVLTCKIVEVDRPHKYVAKIFHPNGNTCFDFRLHSIWSGHSYRATIIGQAVVVGDYGSRKRFKPLKSGGYNYAGIAKAYSEYVGQQQRQKQSADRRHKNQLDVEALKTELGFPHVYSSHRGFDIEANKYEGSDSLKISFVTSGDGEKAKRVMQVLMDADLI